jgi:hypothetical protein
MLRAWSEFAAEKYRRLLDRYDPDWKRRQRWQQGVRLLFPTLLLLGLALEILRWLGRGWRRIRRARRYFGRANRWMTPPTS